MRLFCSCLLPLLLACGGPSDSPKGKLDVDGDGYQWPLDCDDVDGQSFPGNPELCDGIDNNCDGSVDEDGAADALLWYADSDDDGYGSDFYTRLACSQPQGYVEVAGDCDDLDDDVNPEGSERCDDLDNDCNGVVDDDASNARSWFEDNDGDTYGGETTVLSCTEPFGYSDNARDCDDDDATINPRAEEVWYDGVDQDCDDHDDYDADEDNRRAVEYGGDDCDDTDERVNPGQAERCDDKDNDCDSQVDENAVDGVVYFQDSDGDGYGNEDSRSKFCEAPEGYTSDRTDCDDTNAAISPGAEETWYDGLDQDCNAASDYDADEDGYDGVEWGGADCDDTDPVKYPRTWYLDVDEDGYGTSADSISTCDAPANYVAEATDCDDDDPLVSPGATEVCGDGQDNNCDSDAPGCGVVGPLGPSDAWVTLTGEATRDHVGISAAKGDFDGDGLLDLVFGADQNDRGGNYSGSIYVMNAPYIDGSYSAGSASGIVYGPDEYAGFGQSIASVGDIDGDGYDDLLVGAPDHDTGTGIGSGSAWLIPGPIVGTSAATALSTYWLGELSSADAGEALAGGQDVDGDGNPDIAIGASQDDRAGTSSGAVYIFGDSGLGTTSLTEASHLLLGASPAEQLGAALVQGDLDADGVPELVVGAAGYEGTGAALIYARPLPTAGAADDADAVMMGEASGDSAGKVLTICADADDDGYAELLVGAPDADSSGVDSGSAYALSGYAAGSSDLAEAPWLIRSASPGDEVGAALACAGDVEGDGQPDLLVGAPSAGTQGQVFLMPFGAGTTVVSSALATITGESSGDGMGSSVVGLGDMDLDGDDEIGMGAWRANTTGTDAGALYVMLGGPGL